MKRNSNPAGDGDSSTLSWHECPLPNRDNRGFIEIRATRLQDGNLRNVTINVHSDRHHYIGVLMRRQSRRRIFSIDVRDNSGRGDLVIRRLGPRLFTSISEARPSGGDYKRDVNWITSDGE